MKKFKADADVGRAGEEVAAKYLKKNKYRIIARNLNVGKSEIDIVAVKDGTLVFVEVKSRSTADGKNYLSRPADAVNRDKASYLIRGTDRFCAEYGDKYSNYFKRIDIIEK